MSIIITNNITKVLLTSVFPNRIKENNDRFPLLFVPDKDLDDPQSSLEHVRGTYNSNNITREVADATAIGIIRDRSRSDKAYVFHGIE